MKKIYNQTFFVKKNIKNGVFNKKYLFFSFLVVSFLDKK